MTKREAKRIVTGKVAATRDDMDLAKELLGIVRDTPEVSPVLDDETARKLTDITKWYHNAIISKHN